MRKLFGLSTLLLVILLVVPGGTEGQDKKDAKKKSTVIMEDATPQDYEALGKTKEIAGTIVAVDVKAATMTLRFEWQHWEPKDKNNSSAKVNNANAKVLKYQQQIMREYQQAMTAKNPIQLQQALMRLQQSMMQLELQAGVSAAEFQKMFHIVKSSKDFDLEIMDTLKVARSQPEVKYDDATGESVKYTDEQLKKMKSPDIKDAYKATPDDLMIGQGVVLYLSPPKKKKDDKDDKAKTDGDKTAADKTAADKADGDKTDKTEKTLPATKIALPQVRMVLITTDADLPEPAKTNDKKKKKKKDNN
jgi:hypothetical protein